MPNRYNENDPRAAAWLRELIADGRIARGQVDTRNIQDIPLDELDPDAQLHLFAGIGGWSLALRLAGWPDDVPVWTGSCPCQPFSVAGKRKGKRDERHLWPYMRRAIAHACPAIVFGEQVASADGRGWLAGVRADLEALGYAVGAADLCAAGIGAPHIRQRLFWVADLSGSRRGWCEDPGTSQSSESEKRRGTFELERCGVTVGEVDGLGDAHCGISGTPRADESQTRPDRSLECNGRLGDSNTTGRGELRGTVPIQTALEPVECSGNVGRLAHAGSAGSAVQPIPLQDGHSGPLKSSAWDSFELIRCRDEKCRRIEPGTLPLAHGVPGRVGLLRGYGNAIVPQLAAEFIAAYLQTLT